MHQSQSNNNNFYFEVAILPNNSGFKLAVPNALYYMLSVGKRAEKNAGLFKKKKLLILPTHISPSNRPDSYFILVHFPLSTMICLFKDSS